MLVDEHKPSPNGLVVYPHRSFSRRLQMPRRTSSTLLVQIVACIGIAVFCVAVVALAAVLIWAVLTLLGELARRLPQGW